MSFVTGPAPNSLAARMAQENTLPAPTTPALEDANAVSGSPSSPLPRKPQVHTTTSLGLKYISIKAIAMPPRPGLIPGVPPPAPVPGTFPFGDTEDHQHSMMIHWLDELEYTYAEVTRMYVKMFPDDSVSDEAIRRRHIRSLERLVNRYGKKGEAQIGAVGRTVQIRGKPRGKGRRSMDAEAEEQDPAASFSQSQAGKQFALTRQARREATNCETHYFEKTCIVVWRDADHMSFKDIREKLAREHGWSIGETTVRKYYSRVRDQAWGFEARADGEGTGDEGDSIEK
ncbi:hypothetical protein PTMSG1_05490 [Pyrenophora teres f. maculata]|nr:hypothetical protein PTMSG1_05490 [Pyrenophora teres f. maculata]